MNRIDFVFGNLRKEKRKGFVGYLTAGDPNLNTSLKNFITMARAGVDILEVGVPFSDPTADGPVIQAASQRALANGCTICDVLNIVKKIRQASEVPIVLFGYSNPFYKYGFAKLCKDAAKAGVDGFLVVDMPHEEADEFKKAAKAQKLAWIVLVAPTTTPARAKELLKNAEGFVYYITVTGVTGTRAKVPRDVASHISVLKRLTSLPIAAGFGISNGDQAREVAKNADAVVVGSSLIKAANANKLETFIKEIRFALDSI